MKTETGLLRILKRFLFDQKYFCFDLFPHLKSDHEKLQIIMLILGFEN
jgi:hypothetical protein